MDTIIAIDLPRLAVRGLEEARACWRDFEAIISIENEGTADNFRMAEPEGRQHLVLAFEDIDYDDLDGAAPQRRHLEEAIVFARSHLGKRMLVHCYAGRYRSAAVALAILADRLGPGNEAAAVAELVRVRPEAAPNLIALVHADAALGRDGALHAAWMAHEATDCEFGRRRQVRFLIEADRARKGVLSINDLPGEMTLEPLPWRRPNEAAQ